jgi:hypothetical protein
VVRSGVAGRSSRSADLTYTVTPAFPGQGRPSQRAAGGSDCTLQKTVYNLGRFSQCIKSLPATRRLEPFLSFALRLVAFRWLGHHDLGDHFAGHRITDAKAVAKVLQVFAERIEKTDHFRSRSSNRFKVSPFTDEAESLFACLYQSAATKALKVRFCLAVLRNEFVLMIRLHTKPDDVVGHHVILPVKNVDVAGNFGPVQAT